MKILLVGNEPYAYEGVPNYTRPLALKFVELGHDVFFFFSGAWFRRYNWWPKPYLRIRRNDFPFEYAELVNSPGWAANYGNPHLDVHCPQTEKLFQEYLRKIKPDLMHIHSLTGLPASIFEIAQKNDLKVFYTIHEYASLCQKKVMIDSSGILCSGPSDLEKCSVCTEPLNIKRLKLIARLENSHRQLPKFLAEIKKKIYGKRNKQNNSKSKAINYMQDSIKKEIKEGLTKRLDYMIHLMNDCVTENICVSSDVQRTLLRFGVGPEKLLVQHIGSAIAENQQRLPRPLHNPMVIGNIGGVGYYKGIHVLVDAASKIRAPFVLKIFGKYEKDYVENIMQGKEKLPIEFLGRYKPVDLARILGEIDIMVLPSICNDTAPQTIFESYSAGIPIIASDIGGFPDFIKSGVNGFLFRPGDSQDLAEKLEEVLSHPDIIPAFAENIPRLKTITENARELLELYKNHDRE